MESIDGVVLEKKTKNKKTLYNLGLHEVLKINESLFATRVPGGWIYESYNEENTSVTFVSFNTEFIH